MPMFNALAPKKKDPNPSSAEEDLAKAREATEQMNSAF